MRCMAGLSSLRLSFEYKFDKAVCVCVCICWLMWIGERDKGYFDLFGSVSIFDFCSISIECVAYIYVVLFLAEIQIAYIYMLRIS